MYKFKVYFELFGKKMKTEVLAINETQAKEIILSKVKFIKVKMIEDNGIMDFLNGFRKK